MPFWRRRRRDRELDVRAHQVAERSLPPATSVARHLRDERFDPAAERVVLEGVTAERVDFSGGSYAAFQAERCEFVDCDFSHVGVDWLPFAGGGSRFLRCRFEGARIGDFGDVTLTECDFTGAELSGWFTWDADVIDCRFAGRLEGVVFTATDVDRRNRNEIRGNDFRDAELVDVDFRNGVDLDAQLLPQGDDYVRIRDLPSALRRVRDDVEEWADDERRVALEALELIGRVLDSQPDVFERRSFLVDCADDPAVGERLAALLRRT